MGITHHARMGWFEAQAGVIIESGRGVADDLNQKFGAKANIRLEVNANIFLGFLPPKHPLTY